MIIRTSPAKVNLYLRVIRKREDGYHDILSLMQQIDLCDEMAFTAAARGISVRCPGTNLPEDAGNIVYRAAASFFSHIGVPPAIDIAVRKRIPVGAGLGGGSSNASTTLMTLNEMFGFPIAHEDLMKIGTALGADVPFFMFGKKAWASGIGDLLAEGPDLPQLRFVLINPGFELSTKTVYQGLNLRLTKQGINYSIPRFLTIEDLVRGLTNDLETVAFDMYPVLRQIKASLMENGACGTLMTGSGPTIFGIFADEAQARIAEKKLGQEDRWLVFGARSL